MVEWKYSKCLMFIAVSFLKCIAAEIVDVGAHCENETDVVFLNTMFVLQ